MKAAQTPTQKLTSHIVLLFTIILLAMHISLAVYFFDQNGTNYTNTIQFLSYVKENLESMPLQSVSLSLQTSITLTHNSNNVNLFKWDGSTAGYLCDGKTYQTSACSTTATSSVQLLETSPKNMQHISVALDSVEYAGSFQITRCADATCSAQLTGLASLGIASASNSVAITLSSQTTTDTTISGKYDLQIRSSKYLFDSSTYFHSIGVGSTAPCYNPQYSSQLPSSLNFSLYNGYSGCSRFSNITGITTLTYSPTPIETTTPTFDLSPRSFFRINEMQLTVLDLGLIFPTTDDPLKIFLIPKIQLATSKTAAACTVVSDISFIQTHASYIYRTGLVTFIVRMVFISILFPIPFVEMGLGVINNKAVNLVGVITKILSILIMLMFIIEGAIVLYKSDFKLELQNKLRNIGWQGCFTDTAVNEKFTRFPSVFSQTLDDYDYLSYIYLYVSCVGIFTLVLLFIKMGVDLYLSKKKRYGEYDDQGDDDPQENMKVSQSMKKSKKMKKKQNINDESGEYQQDGEELYDEEMDQQDSRNDEQDNDNTMGNNLLSSDYGQEVSYSHPEYVRQSSSKSNRLKQSDKRNGLLSTIKESSTPKGNASSMRQGNIMSSQVRQLVTSEQIKKQQDNKQQYEMQVLQSKRDNNNAKNKGRKDDNDSEDEED